VPRRPFDAARLPSFDDAPAVVLVSGGAGMDFFVEEFAEQAAEALARGGAERISFDDEASADAVSDALLNRSLFSPRRVVSLDVTRILGSESPGALLDDALAAWEEGTPGGRRKAFRFARALLSAVGMSRGDDPARTAEDLARRTRKRDRAAELEELLHEMPEERTPPDALAPALRRILERGNDGVVALLTATAPPKGAALLEEIVEKGLQLEVAITEKEIGTALGRLARARAAEREVTIDPDAIDRLRFQTDERPEVFAAQLAKLFVWAGKGGRIRAADVRSNVEDEASEDIYAFFDALGQRDAGDALRRLDRLFSGRDIRVGKDKTVEADDSWPVKFLGMLTSEIRRMLLIRAALDGVSRWEPSMPPRSFEQNVLPQIKEPVPPFGKGAFEGHPYMWYRVAQRAARYETAELARALARAADVDVALKTSIPPLDAVTSYVGRLIAGE
jgi:DNA polymerase III delta subunit